MVSISSRPPLINLLHSRLLFEKLPGEEAHQKMAHPVRKAGTQPELDSSRPAAVLMILYEKTEGDFHMIFIRRNPHESDKHAGQVGFPGGKSEPSDPDLMYTALREAHEEVAIDLSRIEVIGKLTPLYITVSKFLVHPFLAYSSRKPVLMRQESEIEEILELPLSSFMNQDAVQQTQIHLTQGIVLNHVPCFIINGHIIWGATAMIMNELLEIIQPR